MSTNAQFLLVLQDDGTYLQLVPAKPGGVNIEFSELEEYLNKRHIEFNRIAMSEAIRNLSEVQLIKLDHVVRSPESESVKITIARDRMSAFARFYPPSKGGSLMNRKEIINDLVKAGVKYGVIEENLESFLQNRTYFTTIELAKGTPCIEGKDAVITYYFNTDPSSKPKLNEDGTVDFHTLNTISHVSKDSLLASLEPAVMGRPGIDVCGGSLTPRKVEQRILKFGKKIRLSEDKLKIYSEVDGHASLVNDKVFVSDSYDIPADVDASTGDIRYDGSVMIKGSVRTGYKVVASGDIVVEGVVEGATLEAGGQIILKRGIQGMNKGSLSAKGNIVTKFIENATITTSGSLTTEAILHSNVSAKGDITVGGKKGFITGGQIRSGSMISAKTAGSTMGTSTLLEVGVDPELIEEYHRIEKEIPTISLEIERTNQNLLLYLKKMKSGVKLAPDKILQVKALSVNKETLENKQKEMMERLNYLQEYMDNHVAGSVNIKDTIYPGCKVVIAGVVYYIRTETMHCTLIREQADVIVGPYKLY